MGVVLYPNPNVGRGLRTKDIFDAWFGSASDGTAIPLSAMEMGHCCLCSVGLECHAKVGGK